MDEEEKDARSFFFPMPVPMLWFSKIIDSQAEILHNCFLLLSSPFLLLFSLLPRSIHRADQTQERFESAVYVAARVPSMAVHGGSILVRKAVYGFLGAIYTCLILLCLLVVAVILGVGLVRFWLDEPVFVKERLHFDYTEIHPSAVLAFHGGAAEIGGYQHMIHYKKPHPGVPVGHTCYVSLVFLMPESDYNRDMGMFQVTAELISSKGNTVARSSHPCMLRFRSWPIRMMRTLIMGVPLLLGITSETQTIKISTLKHKEGFPRTGAIRISLVPRAGTIFLPQLYEAEIILKSKLPWTKELMRRWKWTFYVWVSFYVYAILLLILLCSCKPLILPAKSRSFNGGGVPELLEAAKPEGRSSGERGLSETMRRWQENRESRKRAMQLHSPGPLGSTATSMSFTREDTGVNWADNDDDDDDDAESVCYKGNGDW